MISIYCDYCNKEINQYSVKKLEIINKNYKACETTTLISDVLCDKCCEKIRKKLEKIKHIIKE